MSVARIAIDASRSNVQARTGTEWYSHEVIRAIARLSDRPRLLLYDRQRTVTQQLAPGDAHRVIRLPRLWTHVGLSAAVVRDRPDGLFVPSHVVPAVHPRATVVTVHDVGYRFEPESHPRRTRLMLDLTTRWNIRSAARVIAISAQTRDDLVNEYGARPSRIVVVYSGIDHDRFHPVDPVDILSSYGIRQPYVLYLSTVQPRKNIERLVSAFEAIAHPNLALVIAGKQGWLDERIGERIRSSRARDRIVRLGFVPDEHVPALYGGAAAFALPSLYEGFGMGILEAMACGCPVVTSNRSSMPEVAGGAAVLVDPLQCGSIAAGLERALCPQERERLIEAGYRRASQFTWTETARRTLDVIDAAIRS